ncbi:MAG: hypothetical protein QGG14_10890, partial [Planctomycetota bacterium]|nr:hypothetical protein [Planctomycetota bacterium]
MQEAPRPAPAAADPRLTARNELAGRALRVLSRGLLHRLNNTLAVFSSHAQMLEIEADGEASGAALSRDASALRSAVEGSQGAVDVVEQLLREPERMSVCLGTCLRKLTDVLLLERDGVRFAIELKAAPHVFTSAPGAAVVILAVLLLDALMGVATSPATIGVDVRARGNGEAEVVLGLRHPAGRGLRGVPATVERCRRVLEVMLRVGWVEEAHQ